MLVEVLKSGKLADYGVPVMQLHLYTSVSEGQVEEWGWNHPSIQVHSWVSQLELAKVISAADILVLPFSFQKSNQSIVERAFPSKTADYLASGRPILVFGPANSTLVRYALEEGFAEVVDVFDADILARAISVMLTDQDLRARLRTRALDTFARHHDIGSQRADFYSRVTQLGSQQNGSKP